MPTHHVDLEPEREAVHGADKQKDSAPSSVRRGVIAKRSSGKQKFRGTTKIIKKTPKDLPVRVLRTRGKHWDSDGGDPIEVEATVASSLVKLSTSRARNVPMTTSEEPITSRVPLGRVTRSQTKALHPSSGSTPNIYIDLSSEDITPSPARKELSTIHALSIARLVKATKDPPFNDRSSLPVVRGKAKLQTLTDHCVANLEE